MDLPPPLPAVEIDVIDAGEERVQVVIAVPLTGPKTGRILW
jgi:hypothetical protein